MTPRLLRNRVQRRYRAGARLALLASLLAGAAVSGFVGTKQPTLEISHHHDATPPTDPGPSAPPVPDPAIEPASLPPVPPRPREPAAFLYLDRSVEYAPVPDAEVERLVL